MTMDLNLSRQELADLVGQLADTMLEEGTTGLLELGSGLEHPCCYGIGLGHGQTGFSVVLSAEPQVASAMAGRLTGKSGEALSDKVVDDAMMEWLNILAGQIKSFCALEHTMGLPQRYAAGALKQAAAMAVALPQLDINMTVGLVNAQFRS